jgi:starch synthase (maltosyl-transferring)
MFVLDQTVLGAAQEAGAPKHPGATALPVVIEAVTPQVDEGRHPIKCVVGDAVIVEADVFREGHDAIAADLLVRAGTGDWQYVPMAPLGNDRFRASFTIATNEPYAYVIEGRPDHWATWRRDTQRKLTAGQTIGLELGEGRALVKAAADRASGALAETLARAVTAYDRAGDDSARSIVLLDTALAATVAAAPDRSVATRSRAFRVDADRKLGEFSAWYELFPRSQGAKPGVHGTFADAAKRLPAIAAMGFDIVYLPPIHPIGHAFRKGRNNALEAGPEDPGSPWAIGNADGGHTAIEPKLGTFDDFAAFVETARANGLEVALDYALQCSPDHPWIAEHPEWFAFRADGSIQYAENPPKKYQDIVNFNWFSPAAPALWDALRDVVFFWIERGVTVFRVDNPHTKPFAFWEWMIREVRAKHPDVIFLAEAFTRPKVTHELAKGGFTQSYTYFTWRDTKEELTEYALELTEPEIASIFRPNFWPNTPDILSPYLQAGGRPAFIARLVLAATMASNYGIYSGYELCEHAGLPGREEYADSEKYELKYRDFDAIGNLNALITRLNTIRRENPALQDWRNIEFYRADDDSVIFFGKRTGENLILVAVNLDSNAARDVLLWLPTGMYGIADDREYFVEELLDQTHHVWRGSPHRWRLDPQTNQAAIFRMTVEPPVEPAVAAPAEAKA